MMNDYAELLGEYVDDATRAADALETALDLLMHTTDQRDRYRAANDRYYAALMSIVADPDGFHCDIWEVAHTALEGN